MKKFLILLLIIFTLVSLLKFEDFKNILINKGFYKNKIYTNSIIRQVNEYLIKKYNFKKDDFYLVEVKDIFCNSCKSLDISCTKVGYCGKDFIYNIKGKNTRIKYKKYTLLTPYTEHYQIFDDYQKDQITADINQMFKSILGDNVYLVDASFSPIVFPEYLGGYKSRTDKGFFVNYYNGNIEKYIQHENLGDINILINVDVSDYDNIYNEYSNRFEIYSKNYCSIINEQSPGIGPGFVLFFFEKSTTPEEMYRISDNYYATNEKKGLLRYYYYLCGYTNGYSL